MKCPYCGAEVVLKSAYDIYHTSKYKNQFVWVCSDNCGAYVACVKDTTIPKGTLANSRLRSLRKGAHKAFDELWKSKLMSRKDAYIWLAKQLDIPLEACHIGQFTVKQCQRTKYLCADFVSAHS